MTSLVVRDARACACLLDSSGELCTVGRAGVDELTVVASLRTLGALVRQASTKPCCPGRTPHPRGPAQSLGVRDRLEQSRQMYDKHSGSWLTAAMKTARCARPNLRSHYNLTK